MTRASFLTAVAATTAAALPASRVLAAAGAGAGIAPDAALARLKRGNAAFVHEFVGSRINTIHERAELGNGQAPWASILTCADSRVAPEIVFHQGLGDIFVARVAGNVAGPDETASLEYASAVLGSQLIVVMGHSGCGAVKSAIDYSKGTAMPTEDLTHLVRQLQPAVERAKTMHGDMLENSIKANATIVAESLRSNALLKSLAGNAKLKVAPAYCDLTTGNVNWL